VFYMAGEIETLKRIKEAEEEAAKRIKEAEEEATSSIEEANKYRSAKISAAEDAGKEYYEKAIASANAKAASESKKIVDDAKSKAKSLRHVSPDEALRVFEDELKEAFGV